MKWKKTRWLLAAGCAYLGCKLMASGLRMEGFSLDALRAAPALIFSMASFLTAIFLTVPETALRMAEWCSRPFVAILFPSEEFLKPPLSYRLARRYRDEQRHEDAARQYRKIIKYYPDEREAYLELLAIADRTGDREMKERYAKMFRKHFGEKSSTTLVHSHASDDESARH